MTEFEPPTILDFDEAYTGTPPWDVGHPQPALVELFDAGRVSGRVLDSGCGSGELSLLAAARGLEVTGVDISPRAIEIARHKAQDRGVAATFAVADALEMPFADASFDTVVDSGVFHVFDDADRTRYVAGLRRILVPGGRYHLLVFSDAQPGDWGPRRVRRDELEAAFARDWRLSEVVATQFETTFGTAQAWRATAESRAEP